ncbi:MAG: MFS transporter [Asgard group archaeon]|nr:MFS transporter [Asgard group archaeon]
MNQERFPYFRTFLTSMGFFTINLTWSAFAIFVPIFLKNNLSPLLGDTPILYTLIGIIMVLDNIAAIILQPIIGARSDRTWIPKLGRRMPYVIIGIPLAAFFFGMIGTFESTLYLLIISIAGFNISMAIFNTPVISLIPDTLPKEQHSQGSGVMNIVGGFANIVGLLLSSYIYSKNHAWAFYALSIIMLICLGILILNVREKKDIEIEETYERIKLSTVIKGIIKDKKSILVLLLIAVFLNNAGYQIAETFFSSYATAEELLNLSEEKAGYILGAFVVIQIALALPAGLLARRIGALNACVLGVIGFVLCLLPIAIISLVDIPRLLDIITLHNLQFNWQVVLYAILIMIMGFGWILISINILVVLWNIAPQGQTATYTGVFYIFWHLAAISSPFIAGGIFDLVKYITGQIGLKILFLLVLILYVLCLIVFLVIKGIQNKRLKMDLDKEEIIDKRIAEKDVPLKFLPLMLFGVGVRKEEKLIQIKLEHKVERKELKETYKELRKDRIAFKIDEEKSTKSNQSLKEHKKKRKETLKEQREEIKELKDEIIFKKIKNKLTEKNNQK